MSEKGPKTPKSRKKIPVSKVVPVSALEENARQIREAEERIQNLKETTGAQLQQMEAEINAQKSR